MIPNSSIQVISQSCGFQTRDCSDEVLNLLSQDVEFRLRQVVLAAKKFMKHSKRRTMSIEDIKNAISLKNIEPLYGYHSNNSKEFDFVKVKNNDLYFIPDETINILDCLSTPLEKVPKGPKVKSHWLAINGVQPRIPENPIPETVVQKKKKNPFSFPENLRTFVVREPISKNTKTVEHVLSSEMKQLFEKVTEIIISSPTSSSFSNEKKEDIMLNERKLKVMHDISESSSIHQLIPYFVKFIYDQILFHIGKDDVCVLLSLLDFCYALMINPFVHLELYVDQLLHCLLTLTLSDVIGDGYHNNTSDMNHWGIRSFGAELIGMISKRFGKSYVYLKPKIQKTYLNCLFNPERSFGCHYGAIYGIFYLGDEVTYTLLFQPSYKMNIEVYCLYLLQFYERDDGQLKKMLQSRKEKALKKRKQGNEDMEDEEGNEEENDGENEEEEEEEEEKERETRSSRRRRRRSRRKTIKKKSKNTKKKINISEEEIERSRTEARMCLNALKKCCGKYFERISKYFQYFEEEQADEHQFILRTGKSSDFVSENEKKKMMEDEEKRHPEQPQLETMGSQEHEIWDRGTLMVHRELIDDTEIVEVEKELNERRARFEIPEKLDEEYDVLFKLFGESVLPHIDYHIYQEDEPCISLVNMFL